MKALMTEKHEVPQYYNMGDLIVGKYYKSPEANS